MRLLGLTASIALAASSAAQDSERRNTERFARRMRRHSSHRNLGGESCGVLVSALYILRDAVRRRS